MHSRARVYYCLIFKTENPEDINLLVVQDCSLEPIAIASRGLPKVGFKLQNNMHIIYFWFAVSHKDCCLCAGLFKPSLFSLSCKVKTEGRIWG